MEEEEEEVNNYKKRSFARELNVYIAKI